MPPIYLTPNTFSGLTLFIFAGSIAGYLGALAWKTKQQRRQIIYLALALAAVSGFSLTGAMLEALYPVARYWVHPLNTIIQSLGLVFWVQFAYHLPELYLERQRESQVALGLTLLLVLYDVGYALHFYDQLAERVYTSRPLVAVLLQAGVALWALGVFIRQARRADSRDLPLWRKLWRPCDRHSRAVRNFVWINLALAGMNTMAVFHIESLISITTLRIFVFSGVLVALLLITLTYLNYLPERTSFQARLVAITLAFFLGVLSMVGHVIAPAFIASYHDTHMLNLPQTLQFSPNTLGGYDIRSISHHYETDLGEPFAFEGESSLIDCGCLSLDFTFPFYGQSWSDAHITRRGIVTFGGQPPPAFGPEIPDFSLPAIYLTGTDTWAAGDISVYTRATPDELTLTWLKAQQPGDSMMSGAFQLRLYPDGVFEIAFEALPPIQPNEVQYRWQANQLLGAVPGGEAGPQPAHFRGDLPISSGADGIIETYDLDFRAALHHFLTPLFWLMIFSALLVGVGLPLAFQTSLVKPLQNLLAGVRQVNRGQLDVQVPVMVEDEFGYLTRAFNSMAADMDKLVTDLEDRVAERTTELADTAAYLDNILRSATDYAIITVDNQLRIVYINPLAESLYEVSANEVLEKKITDAFARVADTTDHLQAGLRRASSQGAFGYAYTRESPDGLRHIASRFSSVVNKSGDIIGYAHFGRDITQRVQTEAQLLNQQRSLSALEERERIGRELHDGIGQVMGYLNLQMQAGRALLADGKQQAASKLLEQLIGVTQTAHNNVREFILGMNHSNLAATDFWAALQRMGQTFEEERALPVSLSLPLDQPRWLAPPDDLHLLLILQEALTNAYKYADASRMQIIAQQIGPDQAQFIISDDGCGFSPPPLTPPSIGEDPLQAEKDLDQVSPQTINFGSKDDTDTPTPHFGLKIMRERAFELGGDLEIRSAPGEGTQVLVTVKITEADSETADATMFSQTATPLRVLLVDDHPLFLEGLANLLKLYGVIIVGTAHNGVQAQKLARQTQPDLIIMDIDMPICDGIEATRRITTEFPDQRIIMLTVSASNETLFEALKAGASGYLLKNMQAEELFMIIAGLEDGATPIAPELAGEVMAEFQRMARPAAELTERQWDILQWIANGSSYRETAQGLYLSERTVKREMRGIMDALHLNSRAEAEAFARRRLQNEA